MKHAAPVALALALMVAALAGFWWLLFRELAERPPEKPPAIAFEQTGVAALPGWGGDNLEGFRAAMMRSCAHWPRRANPLGPYLAAACNAIPGDDAALKAHLTENWTAWRVAEGEGRLTGYYEPVYPGSREPSARYDVPLHRVPGDLVTARLADFSDELDGTIRGRVDGDRLVPYHDRKAIRQGALDGRGLDLLWLADPIDAFFLQIQGSGRIALPDGEVAYVGYAGQNGRAYRAIGRDLIAWGEVAAADMSMQAIRRWLEANPGRVHELLDLNPSYVFFTERETEGAIGAEGVVVTPERSIAIDRRLWYFGLPFWIEAPGVESEAAIRRLVMGQDTGGAIRGPVRADLFLGPGDEAGERAGRLNRPLAMWLLLPRGVDPTLALR
ncbi:murein transglycosylase A [Minwuia thermotolerans]|uniref:peptidoglycan lytic exotransglycosylase n=1 Tax=Minwuia thermotolerans TaxID=2056226 RepID=A0A2M9FWC3_9PROT|nr:MltA domain-containing protein [Minwuia thermotolerans]PJK27754.1 murein transglycosylase [Minwuia thermotolerans]